jgi:hypothetical protein
MSTGDQTEYIRGKMAERGLRNDAKFMKDGFDRWAESSEPARDGQEEKIPAETQMAGRGGALSLTQAKMLEYGAKHVGKQVGKKVMKRIKGGDLISEAVEAGKQAVAQAKSIINIWRGISSFIDEFIDELTYEVIKNKEFETKRPKTVAFAEKIKEWFEKVKVFKDTLDAIASLASSVGLGRSSRRGGAMTLEDAGKYAKKVAALYMFLKNNAGPMGDILKMRSLQPVGKQIYDVLNPILSAVGINMGSGRGGAQVGFTGEGGVKPIGEDFEEEVSYFMDGPYMKAKAGPRKVYAEEVTGRMLGGMEYAQLPSGFDPSNPLSFMPKPKMKKLKGPDGKMYEIPDYRFGNGRKVGGMEYAKLPSGFDASNPFMPPQLKSRMRKQRGALGEEFEVPEFYYEYGSGRRPVGGASCGGKKPSARGAIVKKVMAEHGLSLPQASKYVKEKGLY